MKVDLHNHSIYSDGLYSIEELLKIAKDNSIDVMALTDHDSCYGCMEAISLGLKYNITVIVLKDLAKINKNNSINKLVVHVCNGEDILLSKLSKFDIQFEIKDFSSELIILKLSSTGTFSCLITSNDMEFAFPVLGFI